MSPKVPQPGLLGPGAAGIDIGQEHCLDITAIQNAQALAHLRQQRAVERVRLVAELLAEIGRVHGGEDDIAARFERYAGIDHELLAALGTDRFPASPMRIVEGAR
jgi:uncharacterized protein YoaH (UPF0181 family)